MAIPRNPSPSPLHFLLLLPLLSLLASLSAAHFSPADHHLLACGATSAAVLHDGRRFHPDSGCAAASGPVLSATAPSGPPPPSPLFRTARIFSSASSYEFHIHRRGPHLLRLHFYPFSSASGGHDLSAAHFHIVAAGFALLTNFTPSAPILKEFIVPVNSDKLVLTFVPAEADSFAFVNAIELVSAPVELLGDIATLVNRDGVDKFHGLSSQAFETLYRVNAGGRKVTPFNDTLWRTWIPDATFVQSDSAASKTMVFSGRIAYPKNNRQMSREVAPDNVYNSARFVDGSLDRDVSWAFPVSTGDRYLVRVHLCDIVSKTLGQLYFNIYVNGYLAAKDFDMSSVAGLAYPYYIDFVVDVESEKLLTLAVGASRFSSSSASHGLLNGVEIMRMNKTAGGMDGDFPNVLIMESAMRRGIGEFVRSVLCGVAFASLLVVLFMLVLRLRSELTSGMAWPRLPTDATEGKLAKAYQLVPSKLDF